MIAGPCGEPVPHFRVLVGSIVVQHQMDVEFSIDGLIDPFQKSEKFLMAVPWLTFAGHGPFQNIQRRE